MILHGDSLEKMQTLEADSFESVVCDPPYGISLRGHKWDHDVPAPAYWKEALRVAVPGAFLAAFGGTRKYHRLMCAVEDGGWEIVDCVCWLQGQGFPKNSGALKPAWEPVVLARKRGLRLPLQIDAARIEVADQKGGPGYRGKSGRKLGQPRRGGTGISAKAGDPRDGLGRYPANVAMDEHAAAMLDIQSGWLKSGAVRKTYSNDLVEIGRSLGAKRRTLDPSKVFADEGGASRFYFVAKASRKERTLNGAIENNHPSVKPIGFMRWLVRLVTPIGGTVLDPFCGSGSTGVACNAEGLSFVGIDNDIESVTTATRRYYATVKR